MGDLFDWWMGGGDWYDRKQARQIDDLSAAHGHQTRALQNRLRQQSADTGARITNLERAVAAVLSLEDTRERLTEYADCAAVRRFARDVMAQLPTFGGAGRGGDAVRSPPDVDDYWLHPAVAALSAVLHPGTGDAAALFEEARRRDGRRAELFAVCVASLADAPPLAANFLATELPTGDVTAEERAVWLAAADGGLGPDARRRFAERLRRRLAAEGFSDDALRTVVANAFALKTASATDSSAAAAALATMRQRLVTDTPTALDALTEGEATEGAATSGDVGLAGGDAVDLATIGPIPADSAPEVTASSGATAGSGVTDNPLAEVLAVLVNEGAEREAPILDAMAESRAALAAIGIAQAPSRVPLGRPAGTLLDLLGADLAAGRGRGSLAADVLATPVVAVAVDLHERAIAPVATSTKQRIGGREVDIRLDGPPPRFADQAPALSAVDGPLPQTPLLVGITAISALAGIVLAVAVAPGFAVLAVAAAAALAYVVFRQVTGAQVAASVQRSTADHLTKAYTKAHTALQAQVAAHEAAKSRAPADLAAIRAAVTG